MKTNYDSGKSSAGPCIPLDLLQFLNRDLLPMNLMCERAGVLEDQVWDRTRGLFEFGLPFGERPGSGGD